MPTADNTYPQAYRENSRKLWCTETGALTKGTALFYSPGAVAIPKGSATAVTTAAPERGQVVALPTYLNNQAFAGVLKQSYPANANGQLVEITYPEDGVSVFVYADGAVTEGQSTYLWPLIGGSTPGQFSATYKGVMGKGVVRARQTTSTAGLVQCEWVASGGEDSGGVHVIAPTAGAINLTKGGATYFTAATIGSNATFTLADGDFVNQRKVFKVVGTIATNNVVITTTTAVQLDGSTALATITMDDINDVSSLVWTGGTWKLESNAGSVLA